MTTYRVSITGDKWPSEYTVEATGWPTAIARAVKEWRKTSVGKGSRTTKLSVTAVKIIKHLQEE